VKEGTNNNKKKKNKSGRLRREAEPRRAYIYRFSSGVESGKARRGRRLGSGY